MQFTGLKPYRSLYKKRIKIFLKMAAINFRPEADLAPSDPSDLPCLFVGKLEHIRAAGYSGVAKFLGDKVDEKVIVLFTTCYVQGLCIVTGELYQSTAK